MGLDQIIDAFAATQFGVVARQQLPNSKAINRRIACGRLVPLYRGVYLVRGHDPEWPAPLMAACLATNGVASHRAAAHLHGLLDTACLEVTVPLSARPVVRGVAVHRSGALGLSQVDRSSPLARTRVARTLFDLAAVDLDLASEAVDAALARRLVTVDYLRRRIDALGRQGRKGAGDLVRLLQDGPTRAESTFERRLFRLLRQSGLPQPTAQFHVRLPDGRVVRLDWAWADELLALEADSYRHHASRRDWSRDHVRNRELTALGWRILPATWDDLTPASPLFGQIRRGLSFQPRAAG